MLAEAYKAICDGGDHPAMAPFDLSALEKALELNSAITRTKFIGLILCETGTTPTANWLIVSCGHSAKCGSSPKGIPIALKLGLLVYNPQRESVWGNKRPDTLKKKRATKKK